MHHKESPRVSRQALIELRGLLDEALAAGESHLKHLAS